MTNEPRVSVGVMSEPQLRFVLHGDYRVASGIASGEQAASCVDGQVEWGGSRYDELLFTPVDEHAASFTLCDVTIGVSFHWKRKEDQTFKGALKLIVEDGRVTAINVLPVEDYLLSVISSEMSATASLELLKAHAVISRSWLLAQIQAHNAQETAHRATADYLAPTLGAAQQDDGDELIKWWDHDDHANFDVCADDHCQRYQGITRAANPHVAEAIKATKGQVLMSDGQVCDTRFSKCCGGR
ncbi:MAG: SpoIID/LytB domain-containing protein, partial [Muribaculaceae bacterium]|nr:SpoIID/LytB domain-containing protein [Muribaculaceae bacterium]